MEAASPGSATPVAVTPKWRVFSCVQICLEIWEGVEARSLSLLPPPPAAHGDCPLELLLCGVPLLEAQEAGRWVG